MNFNQGFGSSQGLGFRPQQSQQNSQWQIQQQQMQSQQQSSQWPISVRRQQQHFVPPGAGTMQASSQGWAGQHQQMGFCNVETQMQTHMPSSAHQQQGNAIMQTQEQLKKQQFEEQKRKLREMSNRGMKSNPKGGKNILDDFMSKTDINLSSGAKHASGGSDKMRPTNVFIGQPRPNLNPPVSQDPSFSQQQSEPMSRNLQPTPSSSQPGMVHSQQSESFSGLSFSQQGPSFYQSGLIQSQSLSSQSRSGSEFSQFQASQFGQTAQQYHHYQTSTQQGNQIVEDDFGDFQGGNSEYKESEHGLNSLNSSTSSLSSLKSSSGDFFQRNDSALSLQSSSDSARFRQETFFQQGNYSNTGQQFSAVAQNAATPTLFQHVDTTQTVDQFHGPVSQSIIPSIQSNTQLSGTNIQPGISVTGFQVSHSLLISSSYTSRPVEAMASQVQSCNIINQANTNVTATPVQEEIDDANKEDIMYGSSLPAWCHDSAVLPSVYKRVLDKSVALDGAIDTERVYTILLASNIAKDKLRDIWAMANKRNPGILVEEELYVVLGLVALAQAGWNKLSIKKLSSCITAPIPEFPEYILLDSESGSVFGGDSLIVENKLHSSPPEDPDDKYSVFRSHSIDTVPQLTLSGFTSSNSKTEVSDWSSSFSNVNDAAKRSQSLPQIDTAETVEDWADFASSGDISLPSHEPTKDIYPSGKTNDPMHSSASLPVLFASTSQSLSSGELNIPSFQVPMSSESNRGGPDFHDSKLQSIETIAAPVFSITNVDSPKFGQHITGTSSIAESQSTANTYQEEEFGDFNSVNLEKVTSNNDMLSNLNMERKNAKDSSSVLAEIHSRQELIANQTHANVDGKKIKDKLDESWDEFTSFSASTGSNLQNSQNNIGILSDKLDADTKRSDVMESFSTFEKDMFSVDTLNALESAGNLSDKKKNESNELPPVLPNMMTNPLSFHVVHSEKEASRESILPEMSKTLTATSDDFADFSSHNKFNQNGNAEIFGQIKDTENLETQKKEIFGQPKPSDAEFADFSNCERTFSSPNSREKDSDNLAAVILGNDYNGKNMSDSESSTNANQHERFNAFSSFEIGQKNEDFHIKTSFSNSAHAQDLKIMNTKSDDFGDFDQFKGNENAASSFENVFKKSSSISMNANQKPLNIEDQLNSFSLSTSSHVGIDSNSKEKTHHTEASLIKSVDRGSSENTYSDPALNANDRYKALTGVLEDSELHVHEWKRCLLGIRKVFESTANAMKKHNLTLGTKKEVFESEQGKEFFTGLKEIFAVACRLKVSIDKSAIAKSNEDLKNIVKEVDQLWREIIGFSSGLPEYSFPDSSNTSDFVFKESGADFQCGICLHDIENTSIVINTWKVSVSSLKYGGKTYHSTCANFWCNRVNPVLPALPPLASGLL